MPDLPKIAPHRVCVLAYQGLCLFEFATAMEVLAPRDLAATQSWYDVFPASLEGPEIRTDSALTMEIPGAREALLSANTIIIPGWRLGPVPAIMCDTLREAHRRGVRLASICTGAYVLAAAGLLDGKRATTHWKYAADLSERHARVNVDPFVLYIDEEDILTSAGSSAGTDLLLHIIRKDFGTTLSNMIARMMVTPPHREGGQAQFIETPLPSKPHDLFANVLEHLQANPGADHSIESLARMAAMSPRTFFRRFRAVTGHTPYDWLVIERTRLAKVMLEDTDLSIDRIADRAGFGAADTFRHHFRRLVGTTPTQFRSNFRQSAERPVPA